MSVVDMVRNALDDARRIVGNFEKSTIELESKVAELEAKLDAERAARGSLEKMLQQIVDLVNPR
jgi:signal transduction histidine kinase